MRRWVVWGTRGTSAVLLLVGCGGDPDRDGLRALENRLATLEASVRSATTIPTAEAASDVRSLERRVAALERRLAVRAAGGAAGDGAAPAVSAGELADQRLGQRRARRSRLRELTEEYRARLASIRQEQTDPTARQQAVREALAWYRDQRRAILAGEEAAQP